MGIKKQYQTIIVACAFTLLFVNTGFTSTSFSIYQSYIVDIPGVGDVGGSVVVTVRTFVSLICMFFTGVYFRRLNPRIGFFIASLFTALAFFLFGRAYSLAGLCVASAFAGIGYGFGGMVASTYLIGNWFRGKVGSVSGIATMGSGVAAIFIPILAGWLIDAFSLSLAFYVEAAIAFILALLLFKFVRVKPEDVGLEPVMARPKPNQAPKDLAAKSAQEEVAEATIEETDEQRAAASPSAGEESADHPALEQHEHGHIHKAHHAHHAHHLHRKRALGHPRVNLASMPLPRGAYVAMIFALVLLGGVSVAGYNYFGILLTTQGVDAGVAALLISLAGIFLTVSKFVVGIVCDKFGTLTGSFCFFILLLRACWNRWRARSIRSSSRARHRHAARHHRYRALVARAQFRRTDAQDHPPFPNRLCVRRLCLQPHARRALRADRHLHHELFHHDGDDHHLRLHRGYSLRAPHQAHASSSRKDRARTNTNEQGRIMNRCSRKSGESSSPFSRATGKNKTERPL